MMQKMCFSRLILSCFGPKGKSLVPLRGWKTHGTVIKCVCSSSGMVPMQTAHSRKILHTQLGRNMAFLGNASGNKAMQGVDSMPLH